MVIVMHLTIPCYNNLTPFILMLRVNEPFLCVECQQIIYHSRKTRNFTDLSIEMEEKVIRSRKGALLDKITELILISQEA